MRRAAILVLIWSVALLASGEGCNCNAASVAITPAPVGPLPNHLANCVCQMSLAQAVCASSDNHGS